MNLKRMQSEYVFRVKYFINNWRITPRILRTYKRYLFQPEKVSIRFLSITMGFRCNCKCPFCSIQHLTEIPESEYLNNSQIKDLIDQALSLGAINFQFSGGEPLLYIDKLLPLIKYIKSQNAISSIVTNGLLLKKYLPDLKKAGLNNVNVSFDGLNEEHNKSRCVPGLFDKALDGLFAARRENIFVAASGVATNENITDGSFEKLLDFLKSHNINLMVTPVSASGNFLKEENITPLLNEENRKKYRELCVKKTNLYTDLDGNIIHPACPAGRENIIIVANGEIIPCTGIMISFGNIKELPLIKILRKMRMFSEFTGISKYCRAGEDPQFYKKWLEPIMEIKPPIKIEDHPMWKERINKS